MLLNRPPATLPASAPWHTFHFLGNGGACAIAPPGASQAHWVVTAGHVCPPPGVWDRTFSCYDNYWDTKGANKAIMGATYDFALLRLSAPTTNFLPLAAYPPASGESVYMIAKGKYGEGNLPTPISVTVNTYGTPAAGINTGPSGFLGSLTDTMMKLSLSNNDGEFSFAEGDSGSPLMVYRNGRYEHCGLAVSGGGGNIGSSSNFMRTDLLAPKFSLFRHRVTADWDDDGDVDINDFNAMVGRSDFIINHFNYFTQCWGDGISASPMTVAAEADLRIQANAQVRNIAATIAPAALS